MIDAPVKPRKRKVRHQDEDIHLRADAETVQALHDLKILYPGWGKSRIMREAVRMMLAHASR